MKVYCLWHDNGLGYEDHEDTLLGVFSSEYRVRDAIGKASKAGFTGNGVDVGDRRPYLCFVEMELDGPMHFEVTDAVSR